MGQLGAFVMVIRECLPARGGPVHLELPTKIREVSYYPDQQRRLHTNTAFSLLKVHSCALTIKKESIKSLY